MLCAPLDCLKCPKTKLKSTKMEQFDNLVLRVSYIFHVRTSGKSNPDIKSPLDEVDNLKICPKISLPEILM